MNEYEMEIYSVCVNLSNARRVVILKAKDQETYMPIWIGTNEAEAIALKLHDITVTRPLTHDLLCTAIKEMGGEVKRIVITELRDDTVYALLQIGVGGKLLEIDCRPSDALAIAVREGAPIFALEAALTEMGEEMSIKRASKIIYREGVAKSDEEGAEPKLKQVYSPLGNEERRKLSKFFDFIESPEFIGDELDG